MRKIFLLGIVFLLLSATANAQVRGGLKAGGNLNFPSWEPDVPVGDLNSAMSFNFGGMLDFGISRNFGIEIDLLYNIHKTEWDYREFDPVYGLWFDYDVTFTLQTLSIPVLARFKFPTRQATPFFGFGPEVGVVLSHKSRAKLTANGLSDEETVDLGDATGAINFAATLFAGVDINLRGVILAPEIRFSLGIADLVSSADSVKNSQLIFLFGVKF